jgi:hypothetical protein
MSNSIFRFFRRVFFGVRPPPAPPPPSYSTHNSALDRPLAQSMVHARWELHTTGARHRTLLRCLHLAHFPRGDHESVQSTAALDPCVRTATEHAAAIARIVPLPRRSRALPTAHTSHERVYCTWPPTRAVPLITRQRPSSQDSALACHPPPPAGRRAARQASGGRSTRQLGQRHPVKREGRRRRRT